MEAMEYCYVEAALQEDQRFLRVVHNLLADQACARCCLRFAGVRSEVYSKPAPTRAQLQKAVTEASRKAKPQLPAASCSRPADPACEDTDIEAVVTIGSPSIQQQSTIATTETTAVYGDVDMVDQTVSLPEDSHVAAVPSTAFTLTSSEPPDCSSLAASGEQNLRLPSLQESSQAPSTSAGQLSGSNGHAAASMGSADRLPTPNEAADAELKAGVGPALDVEMGRGAAEGQTQMEVPDKRQTDEPGPATKGANAAEPSGSAAEAVCPLCLGVLQSLDTRWRSSTPHARVFPDLDWHGGEWQALPSGAVAAIEECVRASGHVLSSPIALDITVPASATLRQLAAWRRLQEALPPLPLPSTASPVAAANAITPAMALESSTSPWPANSDPDECIVSLHEALQLGLAAPLLAQLGCGTSPEAELRVALAWSHPDSAAESDFLFGGGGSGGGGGTKRKRQGGRWKRVVIIGRVSSANVKRLAHDMLASHPDRFAAEAPAVPGSSCHLAARVYRRPLYVVGSYRKLLRGTSHTPWWIDDERRGETSVQEEIAAVVLAPYNPEHYKFISAGREDADVRMLGRGRPFILEVINARAPHPAAEELTRLQQGLNEAGAGVEVEGLAAGSAADKQGIKDGEQSKQKSYLALCRIGRPLTGEDVALLDGTRDLLLKQRTPVRVSHRRSDLVRERAIHTMRCVPVLGSPRCFTLEMRAQAGTYIKEFVHSDGGRTQPSLGDLLGTTASILQLDVLEVHLADTGGQLHDAS